MKKYEVSVNVNWVNYCIVSANSKEEAAAKAKQAMEEILDNISYYTDIDEVDFIDGYEPITIGDVYEFQITD